MNHQVMFLDWDNKKKLVPASFFTFKNSYGIKVYLILKSGIVNKTTDIYGIGPRLVKRATRKLKDNFYFYILIQFNSVTKIF